MSNDEQLFFRPDGPLDARATAALVAEAVGGEYLENAELVGVSVGVGPLGTGTFVTGAIWANDYVLADATAAPDEREVFDGFPFLWSMTAGPRRDVELARRAALVAFRALATSTLGWPMVLTHNFGELVATFDRARGAREFPPGTRSDATDEHLWG